MIVVESWKYIDMLPIKLLQINQILALNTE